MFQTMKDVTSLVEMCYSYNGKIYMASNRKDFRINDIFIDGRDYCVKVIEDTQDILELAYMAPELYVILKEVTVQN